MQHFEVRWQAPEFDYYTKDVSWYWLSIIVAVSMLGFAVWQKNFLFGFFIVVAEILVLTWAHREPPLVQFTLNEKGFAIGDREPYSYDGMTGFSLDDAGDDFGTLVIYFKKRLRPTVQVRLPKERLAEVERALQPLLTQRDSEQSLSDVLEKLTGF